MVLKRFLILLFFYGVNTVGPAAFAKQDRLPVPIQAAPEFSLINVLGGTVNSADLKGKVVAVEFWGTWAKPAHAVIPDYNRLRRELGGKGVEFLFVTFDSGSPEDIKPFLTELKIEFPVVMGTDALKSGFGSTPGYPTTFLVGKDWKVYRRIFGNPQNKIQNLEADIQTLLAQPAN